MGFTFREISTTPKPEGKSEKFSDSHLDISASPCAGQAGLWESRRFCEVPRTHRQLYTWFYNQKVKNNSKGVLLLVMRDYQRSHRLLCQLFGVTSFYSYIGNL